MSDAGQFRNRHKKRQLWLHLAGQPPLQCCVTDSQLRRSGVDRDVAAVKAVLDRRTPQGPAMLFVGLLAMSRHPCILSGQASTGLPMFGTPLPPAAPPMTALDAARVRPTFVIRQLAAPGHSAATGSQ